MVVCGFVVCAAFTLFCHKQYIMHTPAGVHEIREWTLGWLVGKQFAVWAPGIHVAVPLITRRVVDLLSGTPIQLPGAFGQHFVTTQVILAKTSDCHFVVVQCCFTYKITNCEQFVDTACIADGCMGVSVETRAANYAAARVTETLATLSCSTHRTPGDLLAAFGAAMSAAPTLRESLMEIQLWRVVTFGIVALATGSKVRHGKAEKTN